jgi:hypothetical protein
MLYSFGLKFGFKIARFGRDCRQLERTVLKDASESTQSCKFSFSNFGLTLPQPTARQRHGDPGY